MPILYSFNNEEVNLIRDILRSWDGWIKPKERFMDNHEEDVYQTLLDRFLEQV